MADYEQLVPFSHQYRQQHPISLESEYIMADVVDPRTEKSDLVSIKYGKHSSIIEKELIIDRSLLFAMGLPQLQLGGGGNDDVEQIVVPNSDDVEPRAWTVYETYLRTGRIQMAAANIFRHEFADLVDVYRFGEKFGDIRFQDDVMNALLAVCGDSSQFSWSMLSSSYGRAPEGSPLRRLIVDVCIWRKLSPGRTKQVLNEEFLCAVSSAHIAQNMKGKPEMLRQTVNALMGNGHLPRDLVATAQQVEKGMPTGVSCCDYHKHEIGAFCGNKKRKMELEMALEEQSNKRRWSFCSE